MDTGKMNIAVLAAVVVVLGIVIAAVLFLNQSSSVSTEASTPEAKIPPEAKLCSSDSDCKAGDICVGNACREGLRCENPAGMCKIGSWGGECRCEKGVASGWENGRPEGGGITADKCLKKLVEKCGESEPSFSDFCGEDDLKWCVKTHQIFAEKCSPETLLTEETKEKILAGNWTKPYSSEIAECCVAFARKGKERFFMERSIGCFEKGGSCEECRP